MNGLNLQAPILVVEDSDEDYEVLALTFKRQGICNPLVRCEAGEDVFPLLDAQYDESKILPGLILLDLNLVGMNGREVLSQLKASPLYRSVPVLILSTSANPREVEACYSAGANSYSVKPVDLDMFEEFVEAIKYFWLGHSLLPGWLNKPRRQDSCN